MAGPANRLEVVECPRIAAALQRDEMIALKSTGPAAVTAAPAVALEDGTASDPPAGSVKVCVSVTHFLRDRRLANRLNWSRIFEFSVRAMDQDYKRFLEEHKASIRAQAQRLYEGATAAKEHARAVEANPVAAESDPPARSYGLAENLRTQADALIELADRLK